MYIIIKWQGKKYLAKMLENYKMAISIDGKDVPLDQCRQCGRWLSEDEGCYGDGYCDGCAAICIHCERYFNAKNMVPPKKDGEEYVCKECHMKEAKKLWAELGDIPTNQNEEIDVDWKDFDKGTSIYDIWHWFEEEYDLTVAKDLMGI